MVPTNILSSTIDFNIDNNKNCFLNRKSAYFSICIFFTAKNDFFMLLHVGLVSLAVLVQCPLCSSWCRGFQLLMLARGHLEGCV